MKMIGHDLFQNRRGFKFFRRLWGWDGIGSLSIIVIFVKP
jgi:hypothetical protein